MEPPFLVETFAVPLSPSPSHRSATTSPRVGEELLAAAAASSGGRAAARGPAAELLCARQLGGTAGSLGATAMEASDFVERRSSVGFPAPDARCPKMFPAVHEPPWCLGTT